MTRMVSIATTIAMLTIFPSTPLPDDQRSKLPPTIKHGAERNDEGIVLSCSVTVPRHMGFG